MVYVILHLIAGLLITLPEVFLSKNLQAIEASLHWYPSYFGFSAISSALSHNILSEAVLLVES